MSIVQQIDRDLTEALKAREAERLGALRMVKTALKLRETEMPGSLGDEEALRVLNTLIKQRRDAAEQFRAAGREDLAVKEEQRGEGHPGIPSRSRRQRRRWRGSSRKPSPRPARPRRRTWEPS